MKKLITLIFVLLVLVYFFYFIPSNSKGNQAPNFSAELVDGSAFELNDLRGQYVLLDFWGSWCPPCRKDNPNLVNLHKNFHGKKFKDASDFDIVTVALEKDDRRWKKAVEKDGFTWDYQIVKKAKLVLSHPLAILYKVKDVPAKFLIDPDGEIVGVNMKAEEIAAYLEERLAN